MLIGCDLRGLGAEPGRDGGSEEEHGGNQDDGDQGDQETILGYRDRAVRFEK